MILSLSWLSIHIVVLAIIALSLIICVVVLIPHRAIHLLIYHFESHCVIN